MEYKFSFQKSKINVWIIYNTKNLMYFLNFTDILSFKYSNCNTPFAFSKRIILNQLIEKSIKYQVDLCLELTDCQKAFDSINKNFMLNALIKEGVPKVYINVIQNVHI